MSLLELFILAVGLSMDAFAVAVCKGLSMREVSINKAGIVGLYFGGFQAGMPLIGYFLGLQKIKFIVFFIFFPTFIAIFLYKRIFLLFLVLFSLFRHYIP